jgi:hypothetical protein
MDEEVWRRRREDGANCGVYLISSKGPAALITNNGMAIGGRNKSDSWVYGWLFCIVRLSFGVG